MTWLPLRGFAALALAAGLGGFGCLGGQSGTDSDDGGCQTANGQTLYPSTDVILSNINEPRSLEGTWANQRQATLLDVALTRGTRIVSMNEDECFSSLKYGLTGRLTSSDGLVDVSAESAQLEFGSAGTAQFAVGVGMLPTEYLEPAWTFPAPVHANDSIDSPTLILEYETRPGSFVVNAALLVTHWEAVAVWSSDSALVPPRAE
jgi:hypothetical protein